MMGPMGFQIPHTEKIKAAIVNDRGDILTLTRSQHEETRPGRHDWAGGKVDEVEIDGKRYRETVGDTAEREISIEEMPGTVLHNVTALYTKAEIEDGKFKITYLVGATATFPEAGIVLGVPGELPEHIDGVWLPQSDYREDNQELTIGSKYIRAVQSGAHILDRLAGLAQPLGEVPILVPALGAGAGAEPGQLRDAA